MAVETYSFAITAAAGTTSAAPQVDALTMPARLVERIRIRIPPGPRGEVGLALGASGQRVIPWGAGQWFVADDEVIEETLDNLIESGAWQLFTYNTGNYAHTIYVAFTVSSPSITRQVAGGALIPPGAIELTGSTFGTDPSVAIGGPVGALAGSAVSGGTSAPPLPAPPLTVGDVAPDGTTGGTSAPADLGAPPLDTGPSLELPTLPPVIVAGSPPPLVPGTYEPYAGHEWDGSVVWFTARWSRPPSVLPTFGLFQPAGRGTVDCGELLVSSHVWGHKAVTDKVVRLAPRAGAIPNRRGDCQDCYIVGAVDVPREGGDIYGPFLTNIRGADGKPLPCVPAVDRVTFGMALGII